MSWIIKATYPHGGHVLMLDDSPMRFKEKQDAAARAEVLNATTRAMDTRANRTTQTTYIVVEET